MTLLSVQQQNTLLDMVIMGWLERGGGLGILDGMFGRFFELVRVSVGVSGWLVTCSSIMG